MKYIFLISLAASSIITTTHAKFFSFQEEHWNWKKIPYLDVEFPVGFLWGTSESDMQTSGIVTAGNKVIENSWTLWEHEEVTLKDGAKQPRFPLDRRVGAACERWTRYKEDVQLMKQIGIKAHRFSIEWAKIEPQRGVRDKEAMNHYIEYAQEMLDNGILPIPNLIHHTLPAWKYNKNAQGKSGFEDKKTIQEFVNYALYVLTAFKDAGLLQHMRIWITLNEPVAQPMAAYVYNQLPPGKKFNIRRAGKAAKNMLDAHIATYNAFKAIDQNLVIGFTHIMQPIQPYRPWNPFDMVPAKIFDYLVNDVALEYFKTGHFNWAWIVKDYNPDAIKKLDFIGINYYTHTLVSMFKERPRPTEKLSEAYENKKFKAIYPEGLYLSLQKAATLGVPILITENGFAGEDFELRDEYIKKHMYILYKALQDGIDIRGYLFWTLTDCFGWTSAFHSTHGIYKVDFTTQERTLRPNAQYYIDVMNNKTSSTQSIEPLTVLSKPIDVSEAFS